MAKRKSPFPEFSLFPDDHKIQKLVADNRLSDFIAVKEAIMDVCEVYDCHGVWSQDALSERNKDRLDELVAPIKKIQEILTDEINWARLGNSLSAGNKDRSDKLYDWEKFSERILLAAKNAHRGAGPGNPGAAHTHSMVYILADVWEKTSGKKFTQGWHKITATEECEPITLGCHFVKQVFALVAPACMQKLPTATREVVKLRRALALRIAKVSTK